MISELKSIVLTKDITMSQLNSSLERERFAMKDVLEQLGLSRGQLIALEERLVSMQAEKAAADRMDLEIARTSNELAQLQAAYTETSAQLQQARTELMAKVQNAAKQQAVSEQQATQLNTLISDNESRKIVMQEMSDKLLDARKIIDDLTAEALTKAVAISQLNASLERERLAMKEVLEQLGLSRGQLVDLEHRVVAMQVEKAAQSAAVDRMDEAFAKLQSNRRLAQKASEEAAVSLQQAKQEVDKISKEKALLEALIVEFVDYKNETTQTIADLKAKNQNITSLQNEVVSIKEEVAEKEKHNARLLAEILLLKSEAERREERIRNEMLRADDALEKVAFWSHEATEIAAAFEAKTKELESELAAARGHTLASLTSLDQASCNVDRLTSEVAMLKQELLSSQANVDSVTAELKKELLTATALRNDLDNLSRRSLEDAQTIKKAEDAAAELCRCRDVLETEKEKILSDVALIRNDLKVYPNHLHKQTPYTDQLSCFVRNITFSFLNLTSHSFIIADSHRRESVKG